MKIIRKNQTKIFKNSEACTVIEYPMNDKDINGAVIKINGRYPEKGRVVNLKCKELAYIIKGAGGAVIEGEEIKFGEGDLIFINPGEKYFWEGDLTMFVPCAPAWYPEQYKEVE